MAIATRYEVVIGLEVHAQILTESKMFCGCSTDYLTSPPNSNTCPVCLALPGSLPVINAKAVEKTILTGLALECHIAEFAKFDRKNYFYPDLPKGYQISQYNLPLCLGGVLEFEVDGQMRKCKITRVHLEEDTGKLLHEGDLQASQVSLVDFNRAGVPLMEIVSEPDLRSAEEAREYVERIRAMVRYLDVSDGDLESGQLRCDANVSLRPIGSHDLGTKVEVKNMNSFRAIAKAIEYEVTRQTDLLTSGETVIQETRGWNDAKGVTLSQRTKEYAHDYRYFPEPDLPPLVVSEEWRSQIRTKLPELPQVKRARLLADYMEITPYDASVLVSSRAMGDFFEETVRLGAPPKAAANWILGDFSRLLNLDHKEIEDSTVRPTHLQQLIHLVDTGVITGRMAKQTFEEMYRAQDPAPALEKAKGVTQISGDTELAGIVDQVIAENEKSVADYKAGREQALKFLIGQGMKLSKGRANPQRLGALLKEKIA
jgi:aspartyl-tRNA(Asn)/glutamyl-tRNA(Gln) amidotransferase subunit B